MSIITNRNFSAVTPFTALEGVVGEADTDVLTKNAHGLLDGQEVVFTSLTGGTGLAVRTRYYVRDKDANTFKLAATRGGAAVGFTADITDATIVRVGMGVPTGWTITKAGSSEILAGADEESSPSAMPINTYAEIAVDATPAAANMAQAVTLVASQRYRLSLDALWLHQDPAEVRPAHQPTIQLRATGEAHYLLASGAWQAGANSIPIPATGEKGRRLAILFEAFSDHVGYTITIDKGTLQGTAGYSEIVRISNMRIEPVDFDDPSGLPENDDTAFKALDENS